MANSISKDPLGSSPNALSELQSYGSFLIGFAREV